MSRHREARRQFRGRKKKSSLLGFGLRVWGSLQRHESYKEDMMTEVFSFPSQASLRITAF